MRSRSLFERGFSSFIRKMAQKGMIFLETKNAILYEQVKQRLIDGRRDRDETVSEGYALCHSPGSPLTEF